MLLVKKCIIIENIRETFSSSKWVYAIAFLVRLSDTDVRSWHIVISCNKFKSVYLCRAQSY